MDNIYTSLYVYFTINEIYLKDPYIFNVGKYMRETCKEICIKQYRQLRNAFIPLCLESHDKNYFNILRMITLDYSLYIKHEIYDISCDNKNHLNENILINNTMSKWDGFMEFDKEMSKMVL